MMTDRLLLLPSSGLHFSNCRFLRLQVRVFFPFFETRILSLNFYQERWNGGDGADM